MRKFWSNYGYSATVTGAVLVASLFLALKIENKPASIENVLKSVDNLLNPSPKLDVRSDLYKNYKHYLVETEMALILTIGFDSLTVEHPHMHVATICVSLAVSEKVKKSAYELATKSLHMTSLCLIYSPTAIACVCIQLACEENNYAVSDFDKGENWYLDVDSTLSVNIFNEIISVFVAALQFYLGYERSLSKKEIIPVVDGKLQTKRGCTTNNPEDSGKILKVVKEGGVATGRKCSNFGDCYSNVQ